MVRLKLHRPPQITKRTLLYELLAIAILLAIILSCSLQRIQSKNQNLWLGVETIELNPTLSSQYNIRVSNGLLVSRTFVGSPAENAGLKTGDIIQRWDGVSITNQRQIERLIKSSTLNQRITLSVSRNDKPVLVYASLGVRPGIYRM